MTKSTPSKRKVAVTLVLLDVLQDDIPKNSTRIELQQANRIRKIFVTRYDSRTEVKRKICSLFNVKEYTVLDCICAGSKLIVGSNQELNGADAIDRRGCLYLCKSIAKVCNIVIILA